MKLLCFVAACLSLTPASGQENKKFDRYWRRVIYFEVPAARAGEYTEVLGKVKGLTLREQRLVPEEGYSLFENNQSLLVTPGNWKTMQITHESVTKIPGLGERIKWLSSDGSVLAYYCTCGDGGGCRIVELNCPSSSTRWVLGVPGTGPIIASN